MPGYNPDFLGVHLPIPGFSPELSGELVTKPVLRDGVFADYVNYTVVTNAEQRSPIVVALNIDQNQLHTTVRRDSWRIDSRIGSEFQLNNDYYRKNPWDRGHLARRANASWGPNAHQAQQASDETFYYSNASIQHKNFNQDEWLALEDWVLKLNLDADGKIASLCGPIYNGYMRTIRPEGREPALVPSGFFKVVCFINKKTKKLDVRAFILLQDRDALADKSGREIFNNQTYQVSVSEIEQMTGLVFAHDVYKNNPLYYRENENARKEVSVGNFPERIEIDGHEEIISAETKRITYRDDDIGVYIAAAMINPAGKESTNEWISIINLTEDVVDLGGWVLSDKEHRKLTLESTALQPGEAATVQPIRPVQLSNKGGTIILQNNKGERIDRIKYTEREAKPEGKVIVFAYRYTSD